MYKNLTLAAILATSLFTIQANADIAESTRILAEQKAQLQPKVMSGMIDMDMDVDKDSKTLITGNDGDMILVSVPVANTKSYKDTPMDMDGVVLQGTAKITYISSSDGAKGSKDVKKGDLLYLPKGYTYTITNTSSKITFKQLAFHPKNLKELKSK
jgi:hypothetical protein